MPLAQNIQQVSRKATTAIDYNQTDDGDYTESSSCSKTRPLLMTCLVIAIIGISVLVVLYVKEIDDKKNTHATVGPSPTPANRDEKKNTPATVGPSPNRDEKKNTPATVGPSPNRGLIKLDISSSHKSIFASLNKTMMSNTFFDGSIAGPGKKPLINYKGIVADRSILKGDQLDFRFKVEYKIIKEMASQNLIFDLAMCNLCSIDKHWYGGSYCWDMHAAVNRNNNKTVTLYFEEKHKYASSEYFVSSTNVGTTTIVSYHIHVNGLTQSISYNDLLGKHFHTFTNVNFSEPIYILFGLYPLANIQSVFQLV